MKRILFCIYILILLSITDAGFAYPLDAYPETGIRRIKRPVWQFSVKCAAVDNPRVPCYPPLWWI